MPLDQFGFTPTESKVYATLLMIGPSTGYAVAKEARLARANCYQALEGLVRQGGARKSGRSPAKYAAVEPEALVAEIERRFVSRLRALDKQLQSLPVVAPGASRDSDGQLDGPAALLASAEACVNSAAQEVLAVGGPSALRLAPAFSAARARGATVRVLWLGSPAPEGATTRAVDAAMLREYWGGEPLALVSDRSRAVCGVFFPSGNAAGLATGSAGVVPFLRHVLRRELTQAGPTR